jgi:NADH-quinone oxidoreductase subunit D
VVSEVTPHLGYLHRCAEKIGENVTPIQFIPYTDRMDYLAGMNMNLGYSLAVEKLCGLTDKIPEKAQVIRVIVCELNRIASHLVGIGAYGLDLGTFSPFLYAFREREMILDLFEEVCGARLTYSYVTIGGVHDDLPEGWIERCQKFLDWFEPRLEEYHTLLTRNSIFIKRTAGIGVLPKELAIAYGCTGPMLRGSLNRDKGDPPWDLRKIEPYSGYENYDFEVPIPPFADAPVEAVIGDAWHRFFVRMKEMEQSARIVRQALRKYETAKGSHRIEPPRHLPPGEAYVETECPRGQMGFYVVGRPTKESVPLRVRARSSSFCNLSVTHEICRGCLIADVPAIVGSIDIVMGEVDR